MLGIREIIPTVRTFERIAFGTLGNTRKLECWESEAETDDMCDVNLGETCKEGELLFQRQLFMDQ